MGNDVVVRQQAELVSSGRLSVKDVVSHVAAVQEVMRSVMKKDVHYGKVPGTDKNTLYQPGADVLCMSFHIAPSFSVEDLSNGDVVRYRVTCSGVHQTTGVVMGQGIGECSGGEEKYKWRRAVCKEEFDATPVNMRRVKYGKKSGGFYTVEQVRTEPDDAANTVLKMASKRAKVAMVLNVLAVSDMFAQDLEDLSATMREVVGASEPPPPEEPVFWPDENFAQRLPRWTSAVAEGKSTPDQIIQFALTKGALTDAQRAQILALKKAPPPASDEPAAAAAQAEEPAAQEPPWEGEKKTDDWAADYDAAEEGAK